MLTVMIPTRPVLRLPRTLPLVPVLGLLLLVSCSSGPLWVLDSDVPRMPGMDQRLGFDIKRRGGDLVGGTFIFIGPLRSMTESADAVTADFLAAGWSLEGSSVGFPRSSMLFARSDRRVQVVIDADQLEPSMSRAQFTVSLQPAAAPASGAEDAGSGTG